MDPAAPRILLFGHPGSGKSSLLGALQRAGETQGEVLGGEVLDPTGRLPALRDHVYKQAPFERTHTELVGYEVRLKPWRVGESPARTFILHDCDGNAAHALLKHPDPITERDVRGLVASAVIQADLLALVVNAGAADDELDEAFDEFLMLLERVHGRKAFDREVGGFPIALVLTQCDVLFEPGDTLERWRQEADWRLEHALKRFAEFLHEQHPDLGSEYLPFGSVDISGHATAVREPGGTEPFGVAECFRELFAKAEEHRDRIRRSQRGLRRTLWAVACCVWLLFAGAVAVTFWQPRPADAGLAERVQSYQVNEPSAAERLANRNLVRNRRQLESFQSDPGFFALPEPLREYVAGRLQEADDYQAYLAKLAATPAPAEARSLDELAHIESKLGGELALPARYTWGETEAARLRDKWLADAPAIRAAEAAWHDWYRGLANQALALTHTRGFDGEWRDRTIAMEAAGLRKPFEEDAAIPGSSTVPLPRGEAVTQRVPEEFDRVYQASKDWEFMRSRLVHLRGIADALGLTPEPKFRVLEIPPPGTAFDPAERLKVLMSDNGLSLANWPLTSFPDPARTALAARLREQIGNGAKHARKIIGDRFTADTPDGWRKLADGLNDAAIRDWGRLLQAMLKLENTQAGDPVQELAAFLKTPEFALEFTGFDLSIPAALRVPALVPAGPLTVTVAPPDGEPAVRTFKLSGEATSEGLNTLYRFAAEKPAALAFRPGDALKIELPVRSGEQRFTMTWDDSANRTYPFDRLQREPKLVPAAGAVEPATGVTLVPAFGSKLPRLPLLLPDVRR